MAIISLLAQELSTSENMLRSELRKASSHVKKYKVRKRSTSEQRKITIPPRLHKLVQYYVIHTHLREIPIDDAATAFRPGASILDNAKRHQHGSYFVKMDVRNFFPSISAEDFFNSLRSRDKEAAEEVLQDEGDEDLIDALFFQRHCAIGYPVSPYVANIVMREIDEVIQDKLAERAEDFGEPTYTRYADDITISVDRKGFKRDIEGLVKEAFENS